jgi:NAD(P)-dependent dehydrogenase (short-subunit alcohol dehydrogenase family)
MRVALITGASRGLGRAVAVELARRGVHVVITARTQGGLEATDDAVRAAGGAATLLPLDLREEASLDAVGPSLFERFGRLDALVGAAATLGRLTPVPHILPADWEEVMGVNVTANLRLIRSCAPLLLAAPAGRAVFLTCAAAREPWAYWGPYGASKAALERLVLGWAAEVGFGRLRVNLFDPGAMRTRLRATAMPGEDPAMLPEPAQLAPAVAQLCGEEEGVGHGALICAVRAALPPCPADRAERGR